MTERSFQHQRFPLFVRKPTEGFLTFDPLQPVFMAGMKPVRPQSRQDAVVIKLRRLTPERVALHSAGMHEH